MGGFTVMIPLVYIAASLAEELATNPDGKGEQSTEKVIDGLADQLFQKTLMLSPSMSVQAMQKTLKMHGVPPSPLQKLALTQFAATRDPSLNAQVREEFKRLNPATQAELREISREVILRAEVAAEVAEEEESGWWGKAPTYDLRLEKMAGMTAPLASSGKPFDPLKISANVPAGKLYFYREAELKNGRLAMLAFLSIVLTDKFGFHPFFGKGEYISAIQSHYLVEPYPRDFWLGLLVACGFAELFGLPDRSKAPGDQGFDPFGLKPKNEDELLALQGKELNNGRLAMIAMAGIYAQELIGYQGVHYKVF
jgi:hypothetical protein